MSEEFPEPLALPSDDQPDFKPIEVKFTAMDTNAKPDLQDVQTAVLKEGPRSRKVVKFAHVRDRHTGKTHHDALSIQTYRIQKGQSIYDPKHTISLSSEGEDEIQKLLDFLLIVRATTLPQQTSDFLAVRAPANRQSKTAIEEVLTAASATGKAEVLADLLRIVSGNAEFLEALLDRAKAEPRLFAEAAAAINLATYKAAIEELRDLINSEEHVREAQFQKLLSENPWMFGSEYSEVLDRRRWTRDEQQDFVVRRTSDDYIELIEIKTPLNGADLFKFDGSHNSHYAGAELSKVIGQVQNYIEKLDARRDAILADDEEDTCKIRGKIIIGRDGDAEQRKALRRLNGHLHRIEVLTFDQLLRIAERVVGYLENAMRPATHS